MTQTTIQKYQKQYITTFPKQIAEMLRLDHKSKIEWLLINGEVVIRKV